MEIEIKLDAQKCDYYGLPEDKVQLSITRHPSLPGRVILKFDEVYFTISVDELYAALYYFREEAHR
jgi:hypothetical protein